MTVIQYLQNISGYDTVRICLVYDGLVFTKECEPSILVGVLDKSLLLTTLDEFNNMDGYRLYYSETRQQHVLLLGRHHSFL